jgi:hypothetical protein
MVVATKSLIRARMQARVRVASLVRLPYVQAIGVYLAVRIVGVAVLAVMAGNKDLPLLGRLTAWDGQWYLKIAEFGYQGVAASSYARDAAGHPYPDAPMAFFPLYPAFTSLLARIPGVSFVLAALLLSLISGIVAACALFRIGRHLDPTQRRTGLILVALWAGAPMAITLSMTYTEAMFTAFAAWAIVGVLEKNWWMAGLCCMFSGLVRSTAIALIVVVVVAAGIAIYRTPLESMRAFCCALLAPLGLLGYWGSVWVRTGSITGWQDIELRGWNTRFDGGWEAVKYVAGTLTHDGSVMQTVTALILLGAVALAVLTVTTHLPWPLAVYAIVVTAMAIATAGLPFMKARFLLPGFPLLIPIALGLANRRPKTIVATVAAVVLLSAWFSGNALTAWQHAI